jgi:hypothetical protein
MIPISQAPEIIAPSFPSQPASFRKAGTARIDHTDAWKNSSILSLISPRERFNTRKLQGGLVFLKFITVIKSTTIFS